MPPIKTDMPPAKGSNKAKIILMVASLLFVFAFGLVLGGAESNVPKLGGLTSRLSPSDEAQIATNLPEDLDYAEVESIYDELRRLYDGELREEQIMTALKKGLAESTGDPYTEYFTVEESEDFQASLEGTFTGIGAELSKENESIVVVTPLKGFPAEAAGVRAGDIIVQIDSTETTGMSVSEAVGLIRGDEGTEVRLKILREDDGLVDLTIKRAVIDIPSVEHEVRDGVGIITLTQFSSDTTDLVNKAASDFKSQNIDKIILDMRGNPGGFLDQAVSVAGVWLEDSTTAVEVKRGGITKDVLRAEGTQALKGYQTIVLIDGGSASASEIVAGALKDKGAATIVGTKSYGKGSVQNIDSVGQGGKELLKVTTARWFTPNGVNIDKEGISPDIEVERTDEDFEANRDPQLDRALELLLN